MYRPGSSVTGAYEGETSLTSRAPTTSSPTSATVSPELLAKLATRCLVSGRSDQGRLPHCPLKPRSVSHRTASSKSPSKGCSSSVFPGRRRIVIDKDDRWFARGGRWASLLWGGTPR
jgi:hypothetical protein